MPRNLTTDQRDRMSQGARRSVAGRRAAALAGHAAAIEWRESRRCTALVPDPLHPSGTRVCRALAYEACAHRPEGFVE
jgi:hypothetical protein